MNLNHQQSSFENSLAGLRPGAPTAKGSARSTFGLRTLTKEGHKPITVRTVADLQNLSQVRATTAVEAPIVTDLLALREEERNTESPITNDAFSMALEFLEYANVILGSALPRTLLAPDGDGGIGIEWLLEDQNLRVIIPAEPQQAAYVYQRLGRESHIKPFSKSLVVRILRSVILAP